MPAAKKTSTRSAKKVVKTEEPKRAPVKTPEVLVAPARVRAHLDRNGLNKIIVGQIAEQKKLYDPKFVAARTALNTGKISHQVEVKPREDEKMVDGVKVKAKPAEYKTESRDITDTEKAEFEATIKSGLGIATPIDQKLAALSGQKFRMGQDAPVTLSVVIELMTSELMKHAMKYVCAGGRKIVYVNHLHESDPSVLPLYPLYGSTHSFRTESARVAKETAEAAREALIKQIERDVKKQYGISVRAKKTEAALAEEAKRQEAENAVVEEDDDTESESDSESNTSFKLYVGQICKHLINTVDEFKAIRVSKEIRSHVSDIIIDFISRVSTYVLQVTGWMGNKTISGSSIMHALELLLTDGHDRAETLDVRAIMVPDPELVKAEDAKAKDNKDYKVDYSKLPKVSDFEAVRTISYPTSGYAELAAKVKTKLVVIAELAAKAEQSKSEQPKNETSESSDEL